MRKSWLRHVLWAAYVLFVVGGLLAGTTASRLTRPAEAATAPRLPSFASLPFMEPVLTAGPLPKRVTVLVMGLDRRPVEEEDAPARTDSMMLLTLDTVRGTAGMLNFPRDMLVDIKPSAGTSIVERINAVYAYGEALGYPGGGAALARSTVEYNLGVRIDHYVLVDFKGFERMIDAIGGVDVTLERPLVNPVYPTEDFGTMSIKIEAGEQRLNGERALWYARSRYRSDDFDRLQRQRELVLAVRQRLMSVEALPKLPALWSILRSSVQTDIDLSDALLIAKQAWGVDAEKIETKSLDLGYVFHATYQGDPFVLAPNRALIGEVVQDLFYDP